MKIRPGSFVMYQNSKCKVVGVYTDYLELQVSGNSIISVPYDKITYIVEESKNTDGSYSMYS